MIRIGETPVLLTNETGALDRHIEQNHSLEFLRVFCESAPVKIPRGKNLLFPNYPALPPMRLNQLVLPTGATRWGYCLFLVNTDQKDAILEESAGGGNKIRVDFGAPANWKEAEYGDEDIFRPDLSLTMSPLPPRPITPDDLSGLESGDIQNLWILPMVDQRYWWQFRNVEEIEDEEFSDIQDLLDYLNGKMGADVSLSCANASHSEIPDLAGSNNYENAAVVLETLAWHIGCQLVPLLNSNDIGGGSVETGFSLVSVDDSPVIYANNLLGKCGVDDCTRGGSVTSPTSGFEHTGTPVIILGGELDSIQGSAFLPDKIWIPARTTYVSRTASTAGYTGGTIPDTSAVLRLHWKDLDSPTDELADQAAKDYYNRFKKTYDYTFAGIQKWQPTAFDDCLIFLQTRFPDGYKIQTRVRSWHHNLLPETIASVASDGGSHHIEFEIVDVFCPDDEDNEEGVFFVMADWISYTGGCTAIPPGVDDYTGLIKIYDTCVMADYYTDVQLIGKIGYATYLYPKIESSDEYSACEPKWKALSICGEPECA